jgi:hypothetical protein
MCVLINNLEAAKIMLYDLDDEYDSIFSEKLRETFQLLKSYVSKMLGVLVFRVNQTILSLFAKINEISKEEKLNASSNVEVRRLLEFIDSQIEVCADHLIPGMFKRYMKLLWETIMRVC